MKRTLIAIGACLLALSASAQSWPTREVRLIVPGTAGSPPDVIARLLVNGLSARWKQPVVVDNKPGAGGLIGVGAIAKAPPDGHTIGIGYNGPIAYGPVLYRKMPYDPAKDLVPVVMTTSQPNLLVVRADHPARDARQFAEWARANAGKASYGSGGNGTSTHLTMELFKSVGNFDAVHVPFPNSPQALVALIGGDIHAMFVTEPTVKGAVAAGKVKLLAATSKERTSLLPSIPTMVESGYPDFEAMGWNGIFVPAGVPRDVVEKIARDVNATLQEPAVQESIKGMGLIAVGGDAKAFAAYVKEDSATWGNIIRRIKLTLD